MCPSRLWILREGQRQDSITFFQQERCCSYLSFPYLSWKPCYPTRQIRKPGHYISQQLPVPRSFLTTEPALAVSGGKYYIPLKESGPANTNILSMLLSPLKDEEDRLEAGRTSERRRGSRQSPQKVWPLTQAWQYIPVIPELGAVTSLRLVWAT